MKPSLVPLLCIAALIVTAGCNSKDDALDSKAAGIDLALGKKVYTQACAACHDRGLAGAPQTGHSQEWSSALAQGMDVLVKHSIDGYKGPRGLMPARGGHPDLSDMDVTAAVYYMANKSR